jgi:hypothetical protein
MSDEVMRYPDTPQFEDPQGGFWADREADRIVFNAQGRADLAALFARAGINIDTITTWTGYLRAMEAARPHLFAHALAVARGPRADEPLSIERKALVAALQGDEERLERCKRQLRTRRTLRVIE